MKNKMQSRYHRFLQPAFRSENAGDRVWGRIVAMEKNQIKISNRFQGEKAITVTEQTVITKEGQPSTLQDLKVGEGLMAFGKEDKGQFVATRITSGQFPRHPGGGGQPPAPPQ